jgi:hypothetical protein
MTHYYVGTAGGNSNAGTALRPFSSVDAVTSRLQPGDTRTQPPMITASQRRRTR